MISLCYVTLVAQSENLSGILDLYFRFGLNLLNLHLLYTFAANKLCTY